MTEYKIVQQDIPEIAATQFFEIASEQRLSILLDLIEDKTTVSKMAKKLEATVPEVFRNFSRLAKAGMIKKNPEGMYEITTRGRSVCMMIPSLVFMSQNDAFFKDHTFGSLKPKFIQRIGALQDAKSVKGYVKVQEVWQDIYKNSEEYIYNILSEVPYTEDLLKPLVEKLKKGKKVKTIFSESVIVPKERQKLFKKVGFKKFVLDGAIQRKMQKRTDVVLIMNEKKAGVVFPKDGEPDMSRMFYSDGPEFHEWCIDYFNDRWSNASSFQENKMD